LDQWEYLTNLQALYVADHTKLSTTLKTYRTVEFVPDADAEYEAQIEAAERRIELIPAFRRDSMQKLEA